MLAEFETRVDPSKIKPGWEAEVKSYWGEELPQGEGIIYQCVYPIGPALQPDFIPDRFLLAPLDDSGKPVLVFSREDISSIRAPEYTDLLRVPAVPYYPISTVEAQIETTRRSLESCDWVRPVNIAFTHSFDEIGDPDQRELYRELNNSFLNFGHRIDPEPKSGSDIIFTFVNLPQDGGSFRERVHEIEPMVIKQISNKYKFTDEEGRRIVKSNTVVITTIPEDFDRMAEPEIVDTIWTGLARIGTMKIIFIHKDSVSGKVKSYTFATMEGGHSDNLAYYTGDINELRDKLVTHACAGEVEEPQQSDKIIPAKKWLSSPMPDYLVDAGRRFGDLEVFDGPVVVRDYTETDERAEAINFIAGWRQQAPGAAIIWDPYIQAYIVTGTGRHETDKRKMERDGHLVPMIVVDGKILRAGIEGISIIGPSIEAKQFITGFERIDKKIRVSEYNQDYFIENPKGELELPWLYGRLHTHKSIARILPLIINGQSRHVVRHLPQNLVRFPYASGCGKKISEDKVTDAMERMYKLYGDDPNALVVIEDEACHGTDFNLLTAKIPGTNLYPKDPFHHLLNLFEGGYLIKGNRLPRF